MIGAIRGSFKSPGIDPWAGFVRRRGSGAGLSQAILGAQGSSMNPKEFILRWSRSQHPGAVNTPQGRRPAPYLGGADGRQGAPQSIFRLTALARPCQRVTSARTVAENCSADFSGGAGMF